MKQTKKTVKAGQTKSKSATPSPVEFSVPRPVKKVNVAAAHKASVAKGIRNQKKKETELRNKAKKVAKLNVKDSKVQATLDEIASRTSNTSKNSSSLKVATSQGRKTEAKKANASVGEATSSSGAKGKKISKDKRRGKARKHNDEANVEIGEDVDINAGVGNGDNEDRANINVTHSGRLSSPAGTASSSAWKQRQKTLSRRLDHVMSRLQNKGRTLRQDQHPPSDKLIRAVVAVIKLGSYPEVACRAFGIRSSIFKLWVQKGFEDVLSGTVTPYAKFVVAVDAADAQAEVLDIKAISRGIEGWQAKAWLRERKSFQRWGMKALQLQGDLSVDMREKIEAQTELQPSIGAEVLLALEEAGIVYRPGAEHESGVPEEVPIEGRARIQDDGEVEAAVIDD